MKLWWRRRKKKHGIVSRNQSEMSWERSDYKVTKKMQEKRNRKKLKRDCRRAEWMHLINDKSDSSAHCIHAAWRSYRIWYWLCGYMFAHTLLFLYLYSDSLARSLSIILLLPPLFLFDFISFQHRMHSLAFDCDCTLLWLLLFSLDWSATAMVALHIFSVINPCISSTDDSLKTLSYFSNFIRFWWGMLFRVSQYPGTSAQWLPRCV